MSGLRGHRGEGMEDPFLISSPVSPPAKEEATKRPGESPALPGRGARQRSQQPPGQPPALLAHG